jgi:hypothetical protein
MCALKFPVVRAIISQGLDVVLSDIDAIWLRDPFLFFPKDVDLAFQRVVVHPPAVVELWGFSLCSGFVYFHDSPATRSYLEACISWNSKVQSDQVAANLALLEADMRWDLPENYIQQYPIGVEMAKSQFSAFSKISFQGVSGVHHLKALALPPEQFWRHPFIRPRNMVICHPNSPKSQAEKLQILSRWMDRRSDTAQCSQKRS